MPNYTAQYNGRTVTLTGDTPPSEKDFDAAFAQIDNQPQRYEGHVEHTDQIADSAKGLWSGLTEIPRAIDKTLAPVVDPLTTAIDYPIAQGINILRGRKTQPFSTYKQQQDILKNASREDYQPQTGWGKASKFAGGLIPTLALPEAKVFKGIKAFKGAKLLSKIGNMGLTGAYQGGLIGGVNAINNNQNVAQGVGQGATVGGLTGSLLPLGGAIYEKGIAPLGAYMSGVEQKSLQRGLEANQQGRSIFNKNVNVDELKGLGNIVGETAHQMDSKGTIPYEDINNGINDILNSYSVSGEVNPVADALRGKINKIQKYIDRYKPQVDEVVKMPDGQTLTREEFVNEFNMQPEDYHFADVAKQESNNGIKPSALHDIKQGIYDDVSFDQTKGFKRTDKQNEALKQIAHLKNEKLRELSPEYAQANDNYSEMARDLQAKADFQMPLKYKSPYMMARLSAPIFGSFAMHNPALLGLELATSPKLNQYGLQLYNQGTKIAPYIPRVVATGTNKRKNK